MEDHLQYSGKREKPIAGQDEHIFVITGFIWVKYGRRNNKMSTVVVSGWWFLVTMNFFFLYFLIF